MAESDIVKELTGVATSAIIAGQGVADDLKRVEREVLSILRCETDCEVFYKTLLEELRVFKDRHLELRLTKLPYVFRFQG